MKKALFAAAAFGLAGSAMAELASVDRSNWTVLTSNDVQITQESMDSPPTQGGGTDIYSSINAGTAGYLAFPAASGTLGVDDYTHAGGPGGSATLQEFGFVGGAGTPGTPTTFGGTTGGSAGTMFVTWFNSAGTATVTGFGVALPQAGNFIWTITLGGAFTIPDSGIVRLFTYQQGQFFLSSPDSVTVGSNSTTFGGASSGALVHNFRHAAVPEPATVALVALGALALVPRRR